MWSGIFSGFGHVFVEVALALIPLLLFFLIFQIFFLKLPTKKLMDIIRGVVLTFLGLSFFLQGVYMGFFPAGELIGEMLGRLTYNWILIPIGFVLGFVATFAEPAVRILNHEVEKVSGGYIPQKVLLFTLSTGVAISIALSMLRILMGIPLWYFIIPGYLLALLMIRYSGKTFSAIAFDSGGVATGPMTVTFILAMAVGVASEIKGRDPLMEGFGMIALVALSPIISVLILGLLYSRKENKDAEKNLFSSKKHKFIVTIVKKGLASTIVKATRKSGCEGGTMVFGKGTGIHENKTFFGFHIEPEKEVILSLVPEDRVDSILTAIVAAGKLDKPGTGVGFVLDTKKIAGIAHLIEAEMKQKQPGN